MVAAGGHSFRADIQGMRAIAVAAVVLYHVWPTWLPGGYIGVDVFFVISGYLITGLLVRELERTGTISLRDFYARRIRRLLPASATTLFAVAVAAAIWMPVSDWRALSSELVASMFYVQNLLMVVRQVDYLAYDAAPSPLLHFWTLSVEEQFYIFWPLLMLAMAALASRKVWPLRRALWLSLSVVCLLSLGHSIHISFVDPAPGYFLTTTRIWELGIGGLLAILRPGFVAPLGRKMLAWAGLLAIIASAAFYSHRLPFPGYEALLPTLGAAAIIYASLDRDEALGRWLSAVPMQYLGTISYSLYLWHWPVLVFYPMVTGRQADSLQDGVVVVVASIAFAHLSHRFVEERYRHTRPMEVFRPYVMAGALSAGVVLVSVAISMESANRTRNVFENLVGNTEYPGAMAIYRGSLAGHSAQEGDFVPAAGVATLDRGSAYDSEGRSHCIATVRSEEVTSCEYGSPNAAYTIVVVGDSHAVHWLPALEAIADSADWHVKGLTKSNCLFTSELVGNSSSGRSRDYTECKVWGEKVLQGLLKERPDLVILSHSARHVLNGRPAGKGEDRIARGIVGYTETLRDAGIKVAAIRHTPWQGVNVPQCMARPGSSIEQCSTPESQAVHPGTIELAMMMDPSIKAIDMLPYFCQAGVCPAVIGNVLVYRDRHHLTATYARSLAPILGQEVSQLLRAESSG